jgi:hypothetical protein
MIRAAALIGLDLIRSSFAARTIEEGAGEALRPGSRVEDEQAAAEIRMQPKRCQAGRSPRVARAADEASLNPDALPSRNPPARATATKTLRPPKSV